MSSRQLDVELWCSGERSGVEIETGSHEHGGGLWSCESGGGMAPGSQKGLQWRRAWHLAPGTWQGPEWLPSSNCHLPEENSIT